MSNLPGVQPIEDEDLRAALGILYLRFRHLRGEAKACLATRLSDERSAALRDKLVEGELAQLAHDEALWWLHWLYDANGADAAFRYALPRICEALACDFDRLDFDFWKFAAMLARRKWQEWPADDLAVVRRFLASLWGATLRTRAPNAGSRMTVILYALTLCGEDWRSYLATIAQSEDRQVTLNAAIFLVALFEPSDPDDQEGALAWYPAALKKQLRKLLITPEMFNRLRETRQGELDEQAQEQLDVAAAALLEHQLWGRNS